MSSALLIARAQWRSGWRSLLAITLVAGVAGALSLSAWRAAGRAGTSLDRLLSGTAASNLFAYPERSPDRKELEQITGLPGVKAAARFSLLIVAPDLPNVRIGQDVIGSAKTLQVGTSNEFPIIAGAQPDPAAADQILVNEHARDQFGLRIGSRFRLVSFTAEQFAKVDEGKDPGSPAGPVVSVTVTGITRSVQDISDAPESYIVLTPAFFDRYAGQIARLDTAGAYVDDQHLTAVTAGALDRELTAILGPMVQPPTTDDYDARIGSALSVQVLGLRVFSLVGAVAGVGALTLMIARHRSADNVRRRQRAMLGMTTPMERAAATLEFVPVAALSAGATAAGGLLLAPYAITGLAARAEPDPGLWWDAATLTTGALLAAAAVLALAARLPGPDTPAARSRRRQSMLVPLGGPGGPARRYGVRLASPGVGAERGIGFASVAAVVAGIAAVVAVAGFSASMSDLLASPAAYGRGFQFDITPSTLIPLTEQRRWAVETAAKAPPSVTAAVAISRQGPLLLTGRGGPVGMLAETVEPAVGEISPVMRAGRPPRDADEVALGESTQRALGVRLGDEVTVSGGDRTLRVVGSYVLPDQDDTGEGALLTSAGFTAAVGRDAHTVLWIRLRSGVPVETAQAAFEQVGLAAGPPRIPSNVNNLNELGPTPAALALFLALLALVGGGHSLWSTVRRRRADFAVLRALGFAPRQLHCAVRWAALTVSALGVVAGVPLGIVIGRRFWSMMSASLGVVNEPAIAWRAVALTLPVTVALTVTFSGLLGLASLRIHDARWLRTD